jgi:hypothetical protein
MKLGVSDGRPYRDSYPGVPKTLSELLL